MYSESLLSVLFILPNEMNHIVICSIDLTINTAGDQCWFHISSDTAYEHELASHELSIPGTTLSHFFSHVVIRLNLTREANSRLHAWNIKSYDSVLMPRRIPMSSGEIRGQNYFLELFQYSKLCKQHSDLYDYRWQQLILTTSRWSFPICMD